MGMAMWTVYKKIWFPNEILVIAFWVILTISYKQLYYFFQLTVLPNGMQVASVDNNSSISRIAVLYNAGSCYESPKNVGVTHAIRNAVALVNI